MSQAVDRVYLDLPDHLRARRRVRPFEGHLADAGIVAALVLVLGLCWLAGAAARGIRRLADLTAGHRTDCGLVT